MSDTVKLIVEIPKKVFEARKTGEISPWVTVPILDAVQNGTPLDDVKAEIKENIATRESNKSMVRNVGLYLALEIIDKYIGVSE